MYKEMYVSDLKKHIYTCRLRYQKRVKPGQFLQDFKLSLCLHKIKYEYGNHNIEYLCIQFV